MFNFKEMLDELKEEHKEVKPRAPMTTKAGTSKPFDIPETSGGSKNNAISQLLSKGKKKDQSKPNKTLEALLNRGKKP